MIYSIRIAIHGAPELALRTRFSPLPISYAARRGQLSVARSIHCEDHQDLHPISSYDLT